MAVETVERSWEGKDFTQRIATVSTGAKVFRFTADTKKGNPLPIIQPFTRIEVEVEYAMTEKGTVTVRGRLRDE